MNGWSMKRAISMFVRLSANKTHRASSSVVDDADYKALQKEVKALRKQQNQTITAQAKAARAPDPVNPKRTPQG